VLNDRRCPDRLDRPSVAPLERATFSQPKRLHTTKKTTVLLLQRKIPVLCHSLARVVVSEKGDELGDCVNCVNNLCDLCELCDWFYVYLVNSVTC
jgi:hypothetical protein